MTTPEGPRPENDAASEHLPPPPDAATLPPPPNDGPDDRKHRRALWIVLAAVLAALIAVALVVVLTGGDDSGDSDEPSTTTSPSTTAANDTDAAVTSTSEVEVAQGRHVAVTASLLSPDLGAIYSSVDGVTWNKDLDTLPLHGVAAHDDLVVAVGGQSVPGSTSGAVYVSEDGSEWSEPITVPDQLSDVTFAGDEWMAVGNTSRDSPQAGGVIYTSPDARTWTRSDAALPSVTEDGETRSFEVIAFNEGRYVTTGSWCLGDSCRTDTVLSTDGVTWQLAPTGSISVSDLSPDGPGWAMVGYAGNDISGYVSSSGTSTDAVDWQLTGLTPADLVLYTLDRSADGWIAASSANGETPSTNLWSSSDLGTWTQVGSIPDSVSDLVVTEEA